MGNKNSQQSKIQLWFLFLNIVINRVKNWCLFNDMLVSTPICFWSLNIQIVAVITCFNHGFIQAYIKTNIYCISEAKFSSRVKQHHMILFFLYIFLWRDFSQHIKACFEFCDFKLTEEFEHLIIKVTQCKAPCSWCMAGMLQMMFSEVLFIHKPNTALTKISILRFENWYWFV